MSVLSPADAETVKMLDTKAKGLLSAKRKLPAGAVCTERAAAAIDEASAILLDAAKNCSDMPNLAGVREALL
jgi:hypothetical protein